VIALDTNILARAIAEEADADAVTLRQQRQARALLSSGQPLFVPVTVVLELEWVLRGAYGMAAADIAAVLEDLLAVEAHVVGFSMGGMISQQFAVDFPGRVRSLALLATHCGGLRAVQASAEVRRLLFAKSRMSPEQGLHAMRPYTYARQTPDALFDEDNLVRLANPPSARGYEAQLFGLVGWSAWSELAGLRCPTLVMHGLQDELIVPANAPILAGRIRGAELVELPGASHWLMTDDNPAVLGALRTHLSRHSP